MVRLRPRPVFGSGKVDFFALFQAIIRLLFFWLDSRSPFLFSSFSFFFTVAISKVIAIGYKTFSRKQLSSQNGRNEMVTVSLAPWLV